MSNKSIIVANWKMNMLTKPAEQWINQLLQHSDVLPTYDEIVICPPTSLIMDLNRKTQATCVRLGAQDCAQHSADFGAYTGETSAAMLKDLGASYIIIGHSERRKWHNETNDIVRQKVSACHAAQMVAIVCVGESLADRSAGNMYDIVGQQLIGSLPPSANAVNTIIAYEPVWAIGSGQAATNQQIAEMHQYISSQIREIVSDLSFENSLKVIYGGSIKVTNAKDIMTIDNVNGLLIGGASLVFNEFWQITNYRI